MRFRTLIRHRAAVWAGITALLLQAMIPFAQALPGPNGVPVVICKAFGYGASSSGQPRNAPSQGALLPGGSDGNGCVVCFTTHGGKVASTPVSTPLPLLSPAPGFAPVYRLDTEQQVVAFGFLARAPPLT